MIATGCQKIAVFFLGLVIALFFLIYGLCILLVPNSECKDNHEENLKKYVYDGCLAMHCITFIIGFILGIVILSYFCHESARCVIFFVILFVVAWIVYGVVFFTSPEYEIIKNYDYAFQQSYSKSDLESLWKKWLALSPELVLSIGSVDSNQACQSQEFKYKATSSTDSGSDLPNLALQDTWFKKGMVFLDIQFDIEWDTASKASIEQLKNTMLKCPQMSSMTTKFKEINSISDVPSSLLITKNGKKPHKFDLTWVRVQGVFWAGVVLGYELSAIPVLTATIKKTNATFDTSYLTGFNCDQIDWNCWPLDYTSNCQLKNKNRPSIIPKGKSLKSLDDLSRDRLSRAFYLSCGAYDGFDTFTNDIDKKRYTWSTPLVDEWFVESKYNGFSKPRYFIGKHKNDIWIAIRGSKSMVDWVTDATFMKSVVATGCYHKGFYQAGKNVFPNVNKIMKEYQSKDVTFIFTGHSYGGAVANVLHKLALSCYPELKDRLYCVTFGAPPAMGPKTASDIQDHTFSFINGDDLVPCLSSRNIKKFMLKPLLPIVTAFSLEYESQVILWSLPEMYDLIYSEGYENDEPDRPIGNIYHMKWKLWDNNGKADLKAESAPDYNKIPDMHATFSHHGRSYYAKQFQSYKNGVMNPSDFDQKVITTDIKSVDYNLTTFDY